MSKKVQEVRKQGLDKFYTLPAYAKKCIDKVFEEFDINTFDLIVEPSAGNGSFLTQIPRARGPQSKRKNKIVGLDIAPEHPDIIKQDFFKYKPPLKTTELKQNILVIGNPPFGRVSSIAIKFFNHAAEWANVIAFIIPRTFRKPSVQNKLNKMFHLVYDEEVPTKPCCFQPQMMVKCCFQIWQRKDEERETIRLSTKHNDWDFLPYGPLDDDKQPTPPNGADFALRAYGGKIGDIRTEGLSELRPKSWHWIKANIDTQELIHRFSNLDYSDSLNTARQNSMGRGELVRLYTLSYSQN